MKIAADTHVHIYPSYEELTAVLEQGAQRIKNNFTIHDAVLFCLTETNNCSAFLNNDFTTIDSTLKKIVHKDFSAYLLSGVQRVTIDKLEILILGTASQIENGLSYDEYANFAQRENALIGMSWAPGKWLGTRGEKIKRLLLEKKLNFLGDTPMRPKTLPEPAFFSLARKLNIPILAGSDPLPHSKEQALIGTAVTTLDTNEISTGSLIQALATPQHTLHFDKAQNIFTSCHRWLRHRCYSKKQST